MKIAATFHPRNKVFISRLPLGADCYVAFLPGLQRLPTVLFTLRMSELTRWTAVFKDTGEIVMVSKQKFF